MNRIILIAPLLTLAACHRAATPEHTVTPVRVAAVDMFHPKAGARYSASILPGRQVNLSFRVSGFVTDIQHKGARGLEPGDVVAAGSVLARLRQEDFQNTAAQAQSLLDAARETQKNAVAQLAQARASKDRAEADFGRAKTLIEQQSMTRPEYDAARAQMENFAALVEGAGAQVEAATAQIRNAEANVATAKLAQSDTALIAPFTAAVVQRSVEVGMLAGPSVVAYSLADIGTVKAAFGVPDTVVAHMRRGTAIPIHVEALPGQEFRGSISAVAAVADAETKLFQIEVAIANPQAALKPGMIAALALEDGPGALAVPVVPLSAVIRDHVNPANFAVMVVEGNVAKARPVSLGATFGDLLAVTSGVKPGELVIRAGGTLVNDGEAVEVLR